MKRLIRGGTVVDGTGAPARAAASVMSAAPYPLIDRSYRRKASASSAQP